MRPILHDPERNRNLLEQGYVVLKQFLNQHRLAQLQSVYRDYDPNIRSKYYSTIDSYDASYKRHVNQGIRASIASGLEEHFDQFRPLTGNFVVKRKGRKSKVHMHFDISCVDEALFESCVLWMPLSDVDVHNGVLQMLPGSHRFMNPVRGPGVKRYYEGLYKTFERKFMVPVPMQAGDALVFLNRILHFSAPNRHSEERVAARIDLVPLEAKALMYHWDKSIPEDEVAVYAIADDFYEQFRKEQDPLGAQFLEYRKNHFQELPKKQLIHAIQEGDILRHDSARFP